MRSYDTGSRRDSRDGKGRYDLISPFMLERLALRLEHGANHYEPRNWEKGMPTTDLYDSAMRHLNNYMKGDRDEDHLAAVVFNVMAIMHFESLGLEDYAGSPTYWGDSDGVITDHLPMRGELIEPRPKVFEPKTSGIDSNRSVSDSKTLSEKDTETLRPLAKDGLEAHTERQIDKADLFYAGQDKSETASEYLDRKASEYLDRKLLEWHPPQKERVQNHNHKCKYCYGGLDNCPECNQYEDDWYPSCGNCQNPGCVKCGGVRRCPTCKGEYETEVQDVCSFCEADLPTLDGKIKPVGNPIGMDNIIEKHRVVQNKEMDRRELYRQYKRGEISATDFERQMP